MTLVELLRKAQPLFEREGRLIELPADKTIVFVGDTHGDIDATDRVLNRFRPPEHVLVFLGDYVDRGPDSEGNLSLLVRAKLEHPTSIYLLMGNHEGWLVAPFSPADFWESLPPWDRQDIAEVLSRLPFSAWHPAGVLGLHGALPDVDGVEEIRAIQLGSSQWRKITWGDWVDALGYAVGEWFGRPSFGRDFFEEISERLGLKALVRSHQPNAPTYLFDYRCLTIFTSSAYGGGDRRVAVLPPGRKVTDARDLELVDI